MGLDGQVSEHALLGGSFLNVQDKSLHDDGNSEESITVVDYKARPGISGARVEDSIVRSSPGKGERRHVGLDWRRGAGGVGRRTSNSVKSI